VTGALPLLWTLLSALTLPSGDVRGVLSLTASSLNPQTTNAFALPQVAPNHHLRPENSRARAPIPQKDLLISPTQISVYVCGVDPNILRHPVLQADWDRAFVLPPTETLFISVLIRHNHQTVARLSRASSDVRLQPIPPAAEDLAPNKSSLRADGARGSHYGFVASGGSYR
jgi:hypothetical protein